MGALSGSLGVPARDFRGLVKVLKKACKWRRWVYISQIPVRLAKGGLGVSPGCCQADASCGECGAKALSVQKGAVNADLRADFLGGQDPTGPDLRCDGFQGVVR